MPRPSLKETRSEEILAAFMRCVARFGLDGSTLKRISDEGGIGRPLLRHYLGNRDQMVTRLLEYVAKKFEQISQEMIADLPKTSRLDALLDSLFSNDKHSADNAAVFQALVAASDRHPEIRPALLDFVHGFEKRIADEILLEKPHADAENIEIAASGLTAIYFNIDAITPLNPDKTWCSRQKSAAQMLLKGL